MEIQEVEKIVIQYAKDGLTIPEIASKMGFTPNYLYQRKKLFSKETLDLLNTNGKIRKNKQSQRFNPFGGIRKCSKF